MEMSRGTGCGPCVCSGHVQKLAEHRRAVCGFPTLQSQDGVGGHGKNSHSRRETGQLKLLIPFMYSLRLQKEYEV